MSLDSRCGQRARVHSDLCEPAIEPVTPRCTCCIVRCRTDLLWKVRRCRISVKCNRGTSNDSSIHVQDHRSARNRHGNVRPAPNRDHSSRGARCRCAVPAHERAACEIQTDLASDVGLPLGIDPLHPSRCGGVNPSLDSRITRDECRRARKENPTARAIEAGGRSAQRRRVGRTESDGRRGAIEAVARGVHSGGRTGCFIELPVAHRRIRGDCSWISTVRNRDSPLAWGEWRTRVGARGDSRRRSGARADHVRRGHAHVIRGAVRQASEGGAQR
ncbi:unannotated protein [freshwater metagenome]|uniref:Unannotated protein n=1 Tax=freshwater metagenome TaxID=449393 RepID=A0A6J6CNV2_9ZZZZ